MEDFTIDADWGPRPEEPKQIAQRIRSLLTRLRPITPAFERWYQIVADDNMPEVDETDTWLDSVVASNVCKGELGEPIPKLGYFSRTTNEPAIYATRLDEITIFTKAGSHTMFNCVEMSSSNGRELPPSLVNYPIVKQTILALSHAFEPLWSSAGPFCLQEDLVRSRYKNDPVIAPCWMIHLSPPLAQRITPPPDVVSERFDDGSLFLAVTDQTFDPANPAHVEGAQRLFAVLDTMQEKLPPEEWRD